MRTLAQFTFNMGAQWFGIGLHSQYRAIKHKSEDELLPFSSVFVYFLMVFMSIWFYYAINDPSNGRRKSLFFFFFFFFWVRNICGRDCAIFVMNFIVFFFFNFNFYKRINGWMIFWTIGSEYDLMLQWSHWRENKNENK